MPKREQMAQISRPFQIALAALALFIAVWFVALREHNSSTTGGPGSTGSSVASTSAPASRPAPSGAAEARAAAAPTPIYHGSAPGLEGLSRAINHAHGAVAESQADAKSFENAEPAGASAASTTATGNASSASSAKPTATTTVTVKRSVSTAAGHTTVVHTTAVTHTPSATKPAPSATKPAAATPNMQAAVEHELMQGKTVLILFWNPRGYDDVAVHRELPAVQHKLGAKVAVHYASAGQVGAYGTITHAVQITQTPTLLVVNPHGQTTVLTGLTDAFSIEQSISESR
jgi:hypothetical protein